MSVPPDLQKFFRTYGDLAMKIADMTHVPGDLRIRLIRELLKYEKKEIATRFGRGRA